MGRTSDGEYDAQPRRVAVRLARRESGGVQGKPLTVAAMLVDDLPHGALARFLNQVLHISSGVALCFLDDLVDLLCGQVSLDLALWVKLPLQHCQAGGGARQRNIELLRHAPPVAQTNNMRIIVRWLHPGTCTLRAVCAMVQVRRGIVRV